jgi:hypothetical protein
VSGSDGSGRTAQRAERPPVRKWIIFSAWIVGVLILITVIFVGPITLKAYDRAHMVAVDCTVSSASAGTGSSRSVRGIGASYNQVAIDSPDCGRLYMRQGVTKDNKAAIAARFEEGERYRFEVGAASFRWRDALRTVKQAVLVEDPQPV